MVIDLTPEQESRIREAAGDDSRSVSEILEDTALWLLQLDAAQDESLQRALQQANGGEFIEEDEMEQRFQRMIQPR